MLDPLSHADAEDSLSESERGAEVDLGLDAVSSVEAVRDKTSERSGD